MTQQNIRMRRGHIGDHNYKSIQRNYSGLKKDLLLTDSIVDSLISREVLEIDEGHSICTEQSNSRKIDLLIKKLIYTTEKGYEHFLEVLREHGYGDLVTKIESNRGELAGSTSATVQLPKAKEDTMMQFIGKQDIKSSKKEPSQHVDRTLSSTKLSVDMTSLNVADGGGDDTNVYDSSDEYDDCQVGPPVDSPHIRLVKPIEYTGGRSEMDSWPALKHFEDSLKNVEGCRPDIHEKNIKAEIRKYKPHEGYYIIWYCCSRHLLIVTVICRDSPKGRYHYKVKTRQHQNTTKYRFSSEYETSSVIDLLKYVKKNGLPPPIQRQAPTKT